MSRDDTCQGRHAKGEQMSRCDTCQWATHDEGQHMLMGTTFNTSSPIRIQPSLYILHETLLFDTFII